MDTNKDDKETTRVLEAKELTSLVPEADKLWVHWNYRVGERVVYSCPRRRYTASLSQMHLASLPFRA